MAKKSEGGGGYERLVCPLCSIGLSEPCKTLVLRQINDSEAIYVCDNPECVYPVGQEVTIIERKIEEMMPGFEDAPPPQPEAGSLECVECVPGSQEQSASEAWFSHDDYLDPDIGDWLDSQTC